MSLTRTDDQERQRRQRARSLAIGLALGALVILFYVVTIVRLGPNSLRKDGFNQPRAATSATVPGAAGSAGGAAGTAGERAPDCRKAGTC